ncbi:MAG: efflux RND transporter periplasmic adaptor subunit [Planctomycetaceae bacterium]|nr:efflux RND transporter periplasmic adaptor subunit [Planctomycetaceae bacterium]
MLKRIPSLIVFAVICILGAWSVWKLWPSEPEEQGAELPIAAAPDAELRMLSLPADKANAIGLALQPVERRELQQIVSAPGRLDYDDRRHVEIKTATDGVLADVRVKPGDRIDAGAVVAIVSSPEIGAARADVLEHEANLQVAVELRDWKQATCEGLERLAQAVRAEKSLESIRREFEGVQLGSAREEILSAFAKFTLARSVAASLQSAGQSGSVPQRTVQEQVSARDTAAAALDSILEQSLFDARQECRQAKNTAADAQRRLAISHQHLRTLLGFVGEMSAMGDGIDPQSNLSLVEVRAPFAGTIERRVYSATERVQQGDTLFVLADTSSLWITADLRESAWGAAQLQPGDALEAVFPALPGERFPAKVYFVGREVDQDTNALPLVAVIDNADDRLRPGMYAQITLPVGVRLTALAVPDSAVCEHQGTTFVFCPTGDNSFRRVDIQTGLRQGDWTEVRDGLAEGASIVTTGCFQLKSELLLEREEE